MGKLHSKDLWKNCNILLFFFFFFFSFLCVFFLFLLSFFLLFLFFFSYFSFFSFSLLNSNLPFSFSCFVFSFFSGFSIRITYQIFLLVFSCSCSFLIFFSKRNLPFNMLNSNQLLLKKKQEDQTVFQKQSVIFQLLN